MIFDWFRRKKIPKKISGIEVKSYEFPTNEAAEEFFRLQIENANLTQQLRQCENNFRLAVALETAMETSELRLENQKLKLEILNLKQKQKP